MSDDTTVLRFWGKDIGKHTEECVRVVEEAVEEARVSSMACVNIVGGCLMEKNHALYI